LAVNEPAQRIDDQQSDDPLTTQEIEEEIGDGDSAIPDSSCEIIGSSECSESESDDGEGEWITPSNVALHKSKAHHLLPTSSGTKVEKQMDVACMTADFAMQNVMVHMGLNLVDVDGKRISVVKSWILRCHACFKYATLLLLH
jgi:RNA-binding protein NOB1